MAYPSQATPTSSHLSIQSILSPDDRSGFDGHSDTTPSFASTPKRAFEETIPNFAPSSAGHGSAGGFGPDSAAGPPPTPFGGTPKLSSLYPPISPMSSRESNTPYHQHQFLPLQQHPPPPSLPLPPPSSFQTHPDHQQQYYHPYHPQQHHQHQTPAAHLSVLAPAATSSGGVGGRDIPEHSYTTAHSPEYGYPSPATGEPDVPPAVETRKGTSVIKRAPMRSSIACVRCRRSKIKCDNDGKGKSPCETCIKSSRECYYPGSNNATQKPDAELQFVVNTPGSVKNQGPLKREDSGQAERMADRKRLKKIDDAFRLDAQMSGAYFADEVLSAPYLTEGMWTEIFDIYRLHFATELPFLHMPTLKEKMGDKFKASQTRRSANTNLVLLGVLTLTSRFHPDLVKYITYSIANQNSNKTRPTGTVKPDPWAASEYYADVLTKALGPLRASMTLASVERVQAFLMLGLYEWSQSKTKSGGLGAWMYVGVAIRMAQALGLCFGDKPGRGHRRAESTAPTAVPVAAAEVERAARPPANASSSPSFSLIGKEEPQQYPNPSIVRFSESSNADATSEDIVAHEVRRRTMFSCLVLDRLLACGKERLPAIRSEDLQIQLPCSDFSFDLSEKVHTGFLKPVMANVSESDSGDDARLNNNDSVLARFICLVDIWGEISKYSFAGGRLAEKQPPWEDSEFRRLRGVLDDFYANLPSAFTLSSSNYHKHENHQASSAYVSLHMLGAVCQIMLHREYIPFIPLRCQRPMGPLDEPTFPEGSAPAGFWDESADQVFKAARDIVHLIEICQSRKKMPMSALVVFAIWTAAFVGIYAWHFPQLDVNQYMSTITQSDDKRGAAAAHASSDGDSGVTSLGPTGTTFAALKSMSKWLQMASTYVKYFRDMNKFYEGVKKDYWEHVSRHGRGTTGKGSVRLGGDGGGLDEWKVHGPKVTNNGTILSTEDAFAEGSDLSRASSTHSGLAADHHSQPPPSGSEATTAAQCARKYDGNAGGFNINRSSGNNSSSTSRSNNKNNCSGKDNNSLATPTDDESVRVQWLTPASSFAPANAMASPGRILREGGGGVEESGGGDAGATAAVATDAAAAPGSSIGALSSYAAVEDSSQFPDNSMGGGGGSSSTATVHDIPTHGLAIPAAPEEQAPPMQQQQPLHAVQRQSWVPYAQHPPDPQQQHEQQQHHLQQLHIQHQMQQAQGPPPSTSSPTDGYLYEELPTDFADMNSFYHGVSGVEQYVNQHQGMRWQDASQAAGIEQFSHGDPMGPAVWATSPYGVYQIPLDGHAFGLKGENY